MACIAKLMLCFGTLESTPIKHGAGQQCQDANSHYAFVGRNVIGHLYCTLGRTAMMCTHMQARRASETV